MPQQPNSNDRLTLDTVPVQLIAAADGDAKKIARFAMVAYTGGKMRVGWWDAAVIVDLSGMAIASQSRPIRLEHSAGAGVGHTTKIEVVNGQLMAEGVISRATEAARDVVESARNGFPWQASIGASITKYEFVKAGQTVVVNGREHTGPAYVMRQTELGEISFVDAGADSATSATVAAKKANQEGTDPMPPTNEVTAVPAPAPAPVAAAAPSPVPGPDPILATRQAVAAELARIDLVRKACGSDAGLAAKAVAEGWTEEKAQLEALRAARAPQPGIGVMVPGAPAITGDVIQCAMFTGLGMTAECAKYSDQIQSAAAKRFPGGAGLQQMLLEAAMANGYQGAYTVKGGALRDVLRYACPPRGLQAGFSTIDISGIVSTTANKTLLAAYLDTEQVWSEVSKIGSVADLKTVTHYRMTGADEFEKIGPTAKIPHGTIGEESFTNKADTYAKMFAVTREMIINDDLGALADLSAKLGRGAGSKINDVFWTEFLDAGDAFWTSPSYISGSTTALGVDGLTAGLVQMGAYVDADSKVFFVDPVILLVPFNLKVTAELLNTSTELRDNTANTKGLTQNPHAGKYRPLASRYLNNTSYTNYSTTAWYLLAKPAATAVIETVFYGQRVPTIESADADFDTLGFQVRGYFDFGVNLQDKRGGLKSKGAA